MRNPNRAAILAAAILGAALAGCQTIQPPDRPPPGSQAEADQREARAICDERGFGYTGYSYSEYESAVGRCADQELLRIRRDRAAGLR